MQSLLPLELPASQIRDQQRGNCFLCSVFFFLFTSTRKCLIDILIRSFVHEMILLLKVASMILGSSFIPLMMSFFSCDHCNGFVVLFSYLAMRNAMSCNLRYAPTGSLILQQLKG